MATTTVRVHPQTRDAISRLSKQRGKSTPDLLDELVTRAEQDQLLDAMNAEFSRVRSDREAWSAELAERSAWETTLLDGDPWS
jgi:hypothetical protein